MLLCIRKQTNLNQLIHMKTKTNLYLFLIALISAMGGFLFGYDWVVIGGAKPFYEQYFQIANSPTMQGWAMSSALIGCLIGALSAGKLSDRLGRKPILIVAAGLVIFIPTGLSSLLKPLLGAGIGLSLIEGLIKVIILVGYMWLCSRMKEIHRVFEYHGAEHKSIACYEAGLPLTVENIRPQRRFHPRCGTSFLFLVVFISIIVGSFISWDNPAIRMLLKLALIPVVVGISYELIKLAGRSDGILTRIISAPGMWLQRITTCEPDDSQIECAIAALEAVIPEDENADRW